jgi:hypothetical protein
MLKLSDSIERKFVESYPCEVDVKTDTGWEKSVMIHKTIPYEVWELHLEDGKMLECADDHIVFTENLEEVFVKNLHETAYVMTEDGPKMVTSVKNTGKYENMYDLELNDGSFHRYYTNGILSHNTTSMACYIVWCIIFRKRYKVGVAADKDETALEIIDRIKTAYEGLPYWMQQGVKKWDAHKVLLENGSKVDASATTKKTFRGKTYNLVLLDEFAFVDQNIADPFFTSIYPTVSKSDPTIPIPLQTKMVIISTPNGLNHFHKLYDDADKGKSDFKAVEIRWNDVPGRDDKFKEATLRNIGEDRWEQEYNGSFLGSSTSLVPASKLKTLVFSEPRESLQDISIWKPPVQGHTYFISCDVCQGKGLDYHAASVIDITAVPYEVVANFHNNTLDTMMYPSVIFELAKKYNEAFVLIELNNNGKQVSDILYYELEYENVLSTMTRGRAGQVLTVESSTAKGVTMTKPVKSTGCSNLKSLIMSDQLILNDHKYLKELSTFSIQGGQYKAENGSHDDMVMSLVTFSWATTETYFADLLDVNIRQELFEQRIKQLEEDLIPFGVLGNMAAEDEDELMF